MTTKAKESGSWQITIIMLTGPVISVSDSQGSSPSTAVPSSPAPRRHPAPSQRSTDFPCPSYYGTEHLGSWYTRGIRRAPHLLFPPVQHPGGIQHLLLDCFGLAHALLDHCLPPLAPLQGSLLRLLPRRLHKRRRLHTATTTRRRRHNQRPATLTHGVVKAVRWYQQLGVALIPLLQASS